MDIRWLLKFGIPALIVGVVGMTAWLRHLAPGQVLSAPARPASTFERGQPPASARGGRQGFGFGQSEVALVAQFDKDGDGRLNTAERQAARAQAETLGLNRGRGFRGGPSTPPGPGPRLRPGDVPAFPESVPLYDANTVRTLFFTFEDADWHQQLLAFHNTDVEVPATLVVDGRTYRNVGLHYRGQSSFGMISSALKHSINVSVDFADPKQALYGYRTLNLLNSHEDPTYLRTILYLQAARDYIPAPKANLARVVINGESWGAFVSQQQFNDEFEQEWFQTTQGARWKVPGRPGARGGLEYWGEDPAAYKQSFEIKTKDEPKSWAALINLCRVLNETSPDRLESALAPILDVDATLKFLALDDVFVNGDGYWVRASDYAIYLDPNGKFHILPHDANEVFSSGFGPGMRGSGGGPRLDALAGLGDSSKPLRARLLAVPALRARYLEYVRAIATKWLDWKTLQPLVTRYQAMIAADMKTDTHKLDALEDFTAGVEVIRQFVAERRQFLLSQ